MTLRRALQTAAALVLASVCQAVPAAGDGVGGASPLPPEQVFAVEAGRTPDGGIDVAFTIREGYYLYRDRIAVTADPARAAAPVIALPPGKFKDDPNFGRVEIYRGSVDGRIASSPAGEWTLAVRYQGCADAGLCYPPQTQQFRVTPAAVEPVGGGLAALVRAGGPPAPQAASLFASGAGGAVNESERIAQALFSDSLSITLLAFFGAGLLLALTPCVLPMVPILSGLIAGQVGGQGASSPADRPRAFALSFA